MRKIKTAAMVILFAVLFPYLAALGWTGVFGAAKMQPDSTVSGEGDENATVRRILLDRGEVKSYVLLEDYLCGIVAMQIPLEYHLEALRCQAVIARTYIQRLMGDRFEIAESELDLDYRDKKQLEEYWRAEDYEKLKEAVSSTGGLVLQQEGTLILPLFHRVNTGLTRNGDPSMPYLVSVESIYDKQNAGAKQVRSWDISEWLRLINDIGGNAQVTKDQIPDTIQVVERDNAGYVRKLQIGANLYDGDLLQTVLGLPSSAFHCEKEGNSIRMKCTGIGHGYGLSQYGASKMGEEGWKAEDILKYYYKNISIISE